MSAVHWHFEDQTLSLSGAERAWMGVICADLAGVAAKLRVPFATSHKIRYGWHMNPDGFQAMIETAWASGGKPMRLLAAIHGFCETNVVIAGAAFAEVADTLEQGLELGLFRPEPRGYDGYGPIIARLRQGGDWCAWSYSGVGGFPHQVLDQDGEEVVRVMSPQETVDRLRADNRTLEPGELDQPLLRPHASNSLWTMDLDRLIKLVIP